MPDLLSTVRRGRVPLAVLLACVVALAIAACGSSNSSDPGTASSTNANTLLKQTFHGKHEIDSGKLNLALTVTPHGSSGITDPITFSVSGPFESGGKGKLPESDFAIQASIQGQHLDLDVVSAGGHGYITTDGNSYELPASDFKSLESGFASISGSGSGSSSSLSTKGIDPLSWLGDASVVGNATIDGVHTTQIRSTVNAEKMLSQVSKVVEGGNKLGVPDASELSSVITPSEITKISSALGKPDFNVWTGTSDHTMRKLTVTDDIPVTGSARTTLSGMKSADVNLLFTYSDLNQSQTITAPTDLKPYSQFQEKVRSLFGSAESVVAASGRGSSTATTSSSASGDSKYSACILKAKGNAAKMQKCSSLLQ